MTHDALPDSFRPADAVPLDQVRRTLVVKLRQLGDVLLATPVLSVLRRHFPGMRLDALVYEEARPLLAYSPAVDQVYTVHREWKQLGPLARARRELGLARQLRRNRYELVINLTEGDRGAIAALVSGACWRVGRHQERNLGFAGKQWVFTHIYRTQDDARHTVEQHLDALRRIGLRIPLASEPLHLTIPAAARHSLEAKLRAIGWQGEPYLLLGPTSRCVYKCLAPRTVAGLIDTLHGDGRRIVVSCGPGPFETGMVRDILAHTPAPVLDLGGRLELLELGAALERAQAFVGSDSLPMHMAAALQVPTCVWFGPMAETAWGPWMVPSRVVAMQVPCRPCGYQGCADGMVAECLAGLGPERVAEAVRALLAAPRAALRPPP
jgi:lipopolysaccharide heptosyltransferase III